MMQKSVKPIPKGYRSITPNLNCHNADRAIDFYKKVFKAAELVRVPGPDGKIMHAELKIGDSMIFLNDTIGDTAASVDEPPAARPLYLHLYVKDADTVFESAIANGAKVEMPLENMFWGDRYGRLIDPFGQLWGIATHIEDVTAEEMSRRQQATFSKAAGQS
jgi:PhnB protein